MKRLIAQSNLFTEIFSDQLSGIREVADQPIARMKLYMKFIEQRTSAIKEITDDTKIQNKPAKIRNLLEEFTRLVDELQDNLDSYDETHSDIRKALKDLVPASAHVGGDSQQATRRSDIRLFAQDRYGCGRESR